MAAPARRPEQVPKSPPRNREAIIMLTARGEDVDGILGYEDGRRELSAKTFQPRELLARINAVLRRRRGRADGQRHQWSDRASPFLGWRDRFQPAGIAQPAGRTGRDDQRRIRLLRTFCERPGRVLSRDTCSINPRPQRRLVRTRIDVWSAVSGARSTRSQDAPRSRRSLGATCFKPVAAVTFAVRPP